MKDLTLLIIFILLSAMLVKGYDMTFQESLDARMGMAENRWEVAREVNRKKWLEKCAIRTAGWANELGSYYEPEAVRGVWRDCVKN